MRIFALWMLLLPVMPAMATTILVPDDQPTIQAGIDAANPGDSVVIRNGVYSGTGNHDIDFRGKAIVVSSESGLPESCVVDCLGMGRGFTFESGEGPNSILEGITVRNGDVGSQGAGGNLYCSNSSPTIRNCNFEDGYADKGGGAYCQYSSAIFTDCQFISNHANDDEGSGGGVRTKDSEVSLTRCLFANNIADGTGGGISCPGCTSPDRSGPNGSLANRHIL